MNLKLNWQYISTLLVTSVIGACSVDHPDAVPFVESSEISNLSFSHRANGSDSLALQNIMGGGVALFDYDQDGDLDVYLVQGKSETSPNENSEFSADDFNENTFTGNDQLFRNDSTLHDVRFENVTASAGIVTDSNGMGVAVGDLNADGFPDIFVATTEQNQIFINLGNGQFTKLDSTLLATDRRWTSSATIADFNGDNRADIFIGNFIDPASLPNSHCHAQTGLRDYCQSNQYTPLSDQLLINQGNNEAGMPIFEDQTQRFGLNELAATVTVITGDFNHDQWLDLYVANNAGDDLLLFNQNGRRFLNKASQSSVDRGLFGHGVNSMGVDPTDIDHDGDLDLLVSYTDLQVLRVLANNGQGGFVDITDRAGIQASQFSGNAAAPIALDFDHDGRQDIFLANGATQRLQLQIDQGDHYALRMADQWFVQKNVELHDGQILDHDDREDKTDGTAITQDLITRGDDSEDVLDSPLSGDSTGDHFNSALALIDSDKAGKTVRPIWSEEVYASGLSIPPSQNSRGVAVGDFDNDGDSDVLVNNNNSQASLLINSTNPKNWIGVTALDSSPSRVAIGARVRMADKGGVQQSFFQLRSRAYGSVSDPRIRLLVNPGSDTVNVMVDWPDGTQESFANRAVRQYHKLIKGTGVDSINQTSRMSCPDQASYRSYFASSAHRFILKSDQLPTCVKNNSKLVSLGRVASFSREKLQFHAKGVV